MSELSPQQFEIVATLIQSKEPTRTAARLVLVEGRTPADAARAAGVLPQSVSRTVRRCRETHAFILTGYVQSA